MGRKKRELTKNPEILKMNIASCADNVNRLLHKKSELTHNYNMCFRLDSDGLPLIAENNYKEQIADIEEQLIQAMRTLIQWQEEYKELTGGLDEPSN